MVGDIFMACIAFARSGMLFDNARTSQEQFHVLANEKMDTIESLHTGCHLGLKVEDPSTFRQV